MSACVVTVAPAVARPAVAAGRAGRVSARASRASVARPQRSVRVRAVAAPAASVPTAAGEPFDAPPGPPLRAERTDDARPAR